MNSAAPPASLLSRLGTMGDAEFAALAGVTPFRAREWRLAAGIEAANMSSAQRAVRDRRREWTAAWAVYHDFAFSRAEFQAANGLTKPEADFALRDAESAGLLVVVHRGRHGDRYGTPTMWAAP